MSLAEGPSRDLTSQELMQEWGNAQLQRSWGYRRDEFLPQLRGQQASRVYREMIDNDPIVGSVLFAIEMILRRVTWDVDPGGEEDADIEAAEFVTECMDDMSATWEDTIADTLTMLPYGFAYTELVYKQRVGPTQEDPTKKSNYKDGRIGWRKMMLLPQDTITDWRYDDHGGIQAAYQQTGIGRIEIPIEKALLFRTTKRLPQGRSVLRNAYMPWYYKKRIEEVEGIGIERDLAGLPIMYLDPDILNNAERKAEYQNIIRNIRRDEQEGVLLPLITDDNGNKLIELTLLTTGGTRQFDTDKIINRYARQIAMTLLQDVIMMGHEKVGTQSLASEKRDLSDTALAAWLAEIAAIFNQFAIPKLLEINGIELETLPKMVPGDLREEDVLEFTMAIKNLSDAGFVLSGDVEVEQFVRRRMGLPLIEDQDLLEVLKPDQMPSDTPPQLQPFTGQPPVPPTNGNQPPVPPQPPVPAQA